MSEPLRTAPVVIVRRCLIALTGIGVLATAFELAAERHWNDLEQLVPWLALAVLTVAIALLLMPDGRGTMAARVLAVIVLGASVYGVVDHVLVNLDSGALDERFGDVWDSLPLLRRGWYAVTKTVGPAPTLAPGVLAQTALLLLLATVCRERQRPEGHAARHGAATKPVIGAHADDRPDSEGQRGSGPVLSLRGAPSQAWRP